MNKTLQAFKYRPLFSVHASLNEIKELQKHNKKVHFTSFNKV